MSSAVSQILNHAESTYTSVVYHKRDLRDASDKHFTGSPSFVALDYENGIISICRGPLSGYAIHMGFSAEDEKDKKRASTIRKKTENRTEVEMDSTAMSSLNVCVDQKAVSNSCIHKLVDVYATQNLAKEYSKYRNEQRRENGPCKSYNRIFFRLQKMST